MARKKPNAPEDADAGEVLATAVATPGNVHLRITKPDAPFLPGHHYWCPAAEGEKLVRNGVAEYVD